MDRINKQRVIAVVGPTASGKTALSVALAKAFNGEIISADSMQIYKGMNIATAKPAEEEKQGIKHHLMDFLPAECVFSVAAFADMAKKSVDEIITKNKVPIIAGGTGLYVDNLLSGTIFSEGETDFKLREDLFRRLDTEGLDYLLDELKSFDSESYERLKTERNPKRIIRAIEVYRTTGITMTKQNSLSKPMESPYDYVKIGISFKDRQVLYNRINKRVDVMLSDGLLQEAEAFFKCSYSNTATQAIGYKELAPYFRGEQPLDECIESLKQATRRYAKRQLTWFKRDVNTNWFYADEYTDTESFTQAVTAFLVSKGFDLV